MKINKSSHDYTMSEKEFDYKLKTKTITEFEISHNLNNADKSNNGINI